MRRPSAFTLIDTLITVTILSILAGIVYPVMANATTLTATMVMATTVSQVRELIEYHAAIGDVPVSENGYPNLVRSTWFDNERLPEDAWTNRPLDIENVHGSADAQFPDQKTFDVGPDGRALGHTAWYNSANGSFCIRVPKYGSVDTDRLFILVNVSPLSGEPDDDDDDDDDDGDDG